MTQQAWESFRADRNHTLPAPHGWLSLTSLQWLPEEPGPLEGLPGLWSAKGGAAQLAAGAEDGLVVVHGGTAVDGEITATLSEDESLNWVRYGKVLVELALRGGRYAIRTRDSDAPRLQSFSGVPTFDYNPQAVVRAKFSRFEQPLHRTIRTANPHVPAEAEYVGELHFTLDGEDHSLLAQDSGDGLLVNFGDSTNGEETAGWRFLTTSAPDTAGVVLLDFNFALNWPSGFSPFGTCPQPLEENRLEVPIAAGEKTLDHAA